MVYGSVIFFDFPMSSGCQSLESAWSAWCVWYWPLMTTHNSSNWCKSEITMITLYATQVSSQGFDHLETCDCFKSWQALARVELLRLGETSEFCFFLDDKAMMCCTPTAEVTCDSAVRHEGHQPTQLWLDQAFHKLVDWSMCMSPFLGDDRQSFQLHKLVQTSNSTAQRSGVQRSVDSCPFSSFQFKVSEAWHHPEGQSVTAEEWSLTGQMFM